MAASDPPKEFPDVSNKLSAPKKLSAFEKERQAADEKRRRAEAEDAAALKAFQDSFADEDDDDDLGAAVRARGGGPPSGPRGGYGGPPGRGFGGRGRGGGGLDMGPPSLKRKRALDEMREAQEARRERDYGAYEESRHAARSQVSVQEDDREDEAPRPTVQLSRLPPSMTSEGVEALLRPHLSVHSVQFLPPNGPGPGMGTVGKKSLTAIASLATETSTAQIDTAVSALKDKYLGMGFHLSISRHLSSTALHPSMASTTSAASTSTEPFGAEKPKDTPRGSMRNAPPPSFGPPDSYDQPPPRGRYSDQHRAQPEAVVSVQAPLDISTIRAIHILVERLMTESRPKRAMQMEALLMATPSVQTDERFAFLYDSRSPAGVYYRYLLWGPNSPADRKRDARGLERVYDDIGIEWSSPYAHKQVSFLDLTSLADVVTDLDYVSSDEESDDEGAGGGERQFYSNRDRDGPVAENKKEHLNPVKRAKLVHLLSRLPTNNARLRKGDIARVTNFAITHAGQGAEEIVDLLLLNVEKPFAYSLAAKYEHSDDEEDEEEYEPDEALPTIDTDSPAPGLKDGGKRERDDDPSNAKLIALYCISDILSASSTAGARNAWKYRQLFETGFKAHRTFEKLGRLDRELKWGRLKGEQWKRRVGAIFSIWEGWSVFSGDVHEELRMGFVEPPLTEEEKKAAWEAEAAEERKKVEEKYKARFKRVGAEGSASPAPPAADAAATVADDVDGRPMDDIDGAPMALDEDVDGAPMALDEDVDGAPMLDEDADGTPMQLEEVATPAPAKQNGAKPTPTPTPTIVSTTTPKPVGPKRRMRAEDMFASDEE